ncbi:hypothetical protein PN398_14000 [Romboutsia sp. 1001216sp1]|uniref:hypothetical protein n=1 Tax=Romboutsia sp. 1001216sp1 TaxID=2986997 RepID=UPI00232CD25C|nr:hypothetical protein [Romboutsia sp. 1001216sp1]MDB8791834.1 hypothetical protein [Romboutsia sp. 1001216sp1]
MNKKDKFILLILAVIAIIVPIAFMCFYKGSKDWIDFLGTYTGSILSGLITLFIMFRGIKSGKEDLQTSIAENKSLQLRTEKIAFSNEIANLVGEYCCDISRYYYDCISAEHFEKSKENLENSYSRGEISEDDYKTQLNKLESNKVHADRSLSITIFFKLDIMLKNIVGTKNLLETLKKVHNTYFYINNRFELANQNNGRDAFDESLEILRNETSKFIKTYTENL